MPQVNLTAKEIHILVQAIRIATEDGSIAEFAKRVEINQLRDKLQNIKDI